MAKAERKPFSKPKPSNEVPVRLMFYYQGFYDLSTERQIGMSFGPIPWTKIVEYGRFYELNQDQMDFLIRAITMMDSAWLKAQHDNQKEEDARRGRS